MKLAEIVYHPNYLDTVFKILKSICYNCSKLLIPPDKLPSILAISKPLRLNTISKTRSKICGFGGTNGCECKQPKYKKRKIDILIKKNGKKVDLNDEDSKRVFRACEVYEIFKEITDETIELMGLSNMFSRPEFMLIRLLIVVPPPVRPSVELPTGLRSEDDLTHLY